MIRSAASRPQQFRLNLAASDCFLARKIKSEYLSDRAVNANNFYLSDDKCLMIIGENLSVGGSLTADQAEEVLSMCSFLGLYGLESMQDDLPIPHRTVMNIMEHTAGGGTPDSDMVKNENIYQFSQFSCGNFPGSAFNTVYSYFARKVNKGVSDIYYKTQQGRIVSGALATRFDSDIYITFVSTGRQHRHRGLASRVVKHIISCYPDSRIFLMCEQELTAFYTGLGFEKTGETYLYKLREEHI